jgi:large subunit ribosomal protein L21
MEVNNAATGNEQDYAVIRFSGRQFRVQKGQKLTVDRLQGSPGEQVTIQEVLLFKTGGEKDAPGKTVVGTPLVQGASVSAKIIAHRQDKKVRVFKKKRRTGYTKRQGHRHQLTDIMIEGITAPA